MFMFSDVYSYSGPLVVMDNVISAYIGETYTGGYCPICKKFFAKVSQHITVSHPKDIQFTSIQELTDEKVKTEAMEQLIRNGNWECLNRRSLSTGHGLFIPARRSNEFRRADSMVVCNFCYSGLDKAHYSRHLKTFCPYSITTEEGCSALTNDLPNYTGYELNLLLP